MVDQRRPPPDVHNWRELEMYYVGTRDKAQTNRTKTDEWKYILTVVIYLDEGCDKILTRVKYVMTRDVSGITYIMIFFESTVILGYYFHFQ